MGKTSQDDIARRRLSILQQVFKSRTVSLDMLQEWLLTKFGIQDRRTVQSDVRELRDLGFPIEMTRTNVMISPWEMQAVWDGTDVGMRLAGLRSTEFKQSKGVLTEKVLDFVGRTQDIHVLLLGTGTTVYEIANRIFARQDGLEVTDIYTSSVLVMSAFVHHKPCGVTLHIAGGRLDRETAWLRSDEGIKSLQETPVDAVITSFMGLSEEGFSTAQDFEIPEKRMNLHPHERCKFVLIPLEWSKIDRTGGVPVTGKSFSFSAGETKYIILTDSPKDISGGGHRRRLKILSEWARKGSFSLDSATQFIIGSKPDKFESNA